MNGLNETNGTNCESITLPEEEDSQKCGQNSDENNLDLNQRILSSAENGDLLTVKKCIKFDPNCVGVVDTDGYTPLHRSTYNNHIEVMKYLIQSGADVSAQTIDGWTPLHCAAKWAHIQAIDLLLNCGANINAVSNGGNTPLHLAANHNNRPLLELLLHNEDIDIDIKNDSGETAYQLAKRSSRLYELWDNL